MERADVFRDVTKRRIVPPCLQHAFPELARLVLLLTEVIIEFSTYCMAHALQLRMKLYRFQLRVEVRPSAVNVLQHPSLQARAVLS